MIKTTLLTATLLLSYAAISGTAYAAPKDALWGARSEIQEPPARTVYAQAVYPAMREHSPNCFPALSGGGNVGYNHRLHGGY